MHSLVPPLTPTLCAHTRARTRTGTAAPPAAAPRTAPAAPCPARPGPARSPQGCQPCLESMEIPRGETGKATLEELPVPAKCTSQNPCRVPLVSKGIFRITWFKRRGNMPTWKTFLRLNTSRKALFPYCSSEQQRHRHFA